MSTNTRPALSRLALACALAVWTIGVAHAGDNSMNRFAGGSYAYFNSLGEYSAVGNRAATPAPPSGVVAREEAAYRAAMASCRRGPYSDLNTCINQAGLDMQSKTTPMSSNLAKVGSPQAQTICADLRGSDKRACLLNDNAGA